MQSSLGLYRQLLNFMEDLIHQSFRQQKGENPAFNLPTKNWGQRYSVPIPRDVPSFPSNYFLDVWKEAEPIQNRERCWWGPIRYSSWNTSTGPLKAVGSWSQLSSVPVTEQKWKRRKGCSLVSQFQPQSKKLRSVKSSCPQPKLHGAASTWLGPVQPWGRTSSRLGQHLCCPWIWNPKTCAPASIEPSRFKHQALGSF